jgi:dCMP deaminase
MEGTPSTGLSELEALLEVAKAAALRSPNRVRQIGAALLTVDGTRLSGCNNFPRGVHDIEDRHRGDEPWLWTEHAERNVIFAAAKRGLSTQGATLAATFYPCVDCARAIVQAGIARLYTYEPLLRNAFWVEHFRCSPVILAEGGVEVRLAGAVPPKR